MAAVPNEGGYIVVSRSHHSVRVRVLVYVRDGVVVRMHPLVDDA